MNCLPICSNSTCRERGVALLILLAVLGLVAVFVLIGRLGGNRLQNERDPITETALAQAKEALIGYAATYRDTHPNEVFGYLPCPDTNAISETAGSAAGNCGPMGNTAVGRLPYRTLGLPDLRDSSGNCLWYAVSGRFKNNPPQVQLNWDTPGSITLLDNDGTVIAGDSDGHLGVAAVVFAPGPPIAGQIRSASSIPCGDLPFPPTAFLDDPNAVYEQSTLVVRQGNPADPTNNDRMISISPTEIFERVKLRTTDFPAQIDALMGYMRVCVESTFPSPISRIPSAAGLTLGRVPIAEDSEPSFCISETHAATYTSYWQNWQEQFHYVRCDGSVSEKCLDVAGTACHGALIFSGERRAGQSRLTNAEKSDLANYLEDSNLDLVNQALVASAASRVALTGSLSYSLSLLEPPGRDVVVCLNRPVDPNRMSFDDDLPTFRVTTAPSLAGQPLVSIDQDPNDPYLNIGRLNLTAGGVPASDLFGCAFSERVLGFASGLRAYFKFSIENIGDGFTFAIADAQSNPSASMCGAAGGQLGYSGSAPAGSTLPPINPPKIGIEFDTLRNVGAPPGGSNDPNGRHAAIVFWGALANGSDDNAHGLPASVIIGTDARNPSTPPGIAQINNLTSSNAANRTFHVRLEIDRNYAPEAAQGTYSVRAWIINDNQIVTARALETLKDLSAPLTTSPTLNQDSLVVADSAFGGEAFRTLRAGFTTGQTSADQVVRISGFDLRTF